MKGFAVESIEPMTLSRHGRLSDMYVLSPYVWKSGKRYEILIRAVPRRDDEPRLKMAEIWWGQSDDGLHFDMDRAPVIFPGPGLDDLDGCEDPTVIVDKGRVHMWYTGWNQHQRTGRLLYAAGPDAPRLVKQRLVLDSTPPYANPKEATVVPSGDGRWRLFFEYAEDHASKIGMATADSLEGPWMIDGPAIERRKNSWDCWHLSTGPIVDGGSDRPVMFYNGATQDAHWRIGWAAFDKNYTRIVARGAEPAVEPHEVTKGATDIAFASSAVEEGELIHLYYSVSDQDIHRATLRRL